MFLILKKNKRTHEILGHNSFTINHTIPEEKTSRGKTSSSFSILLPATLFSFTSRLRLLKHIGNDLPIIFQQQLKLELDCSKFMSWPVLMKYNFNQKVFYGTEDVHIFLSKKNWRALFFKILKIPLKKGHLGKHE